MLKRNPFSMTDEELVEYIQDPDNYQYNDTSSFNTEGVMGVLVEAYDPIIEQDENQMKLTEGEKLANYWQESKYVVPAFQKPKPEQVLINMNIAEVIDDHRKKDEMQQMSSFFNPNTGNTDEERAKSTTMNQLLAEINNFAIQYNLSAQQKSQLQTQVLSNHLGEYIQTKNKLSNQSLREERQKEKDLAEGRTGAGSRQPDDVVNGFDENNMRKDKDEDEESAGGRTDGGRTDATAETLAGDPGITDELLQQMQGGGAAAGDGGNAVSRLSQADETARLLLETLVNEERAGNTVARDVRETLRTFSTTDINFYVRAYARFLSGNKLGNKQTALLDVGNRKEQMQFIMEVVGLGETLNKTEMDFLTAILSKASNQLKG